MESQSKAEINNNRGGDGDRSALSPSKQTSIMKPKCLFTANPAPPAPPPFSAASKVCIFFFFLIL